MLQIVKSVGGYTHCSDFSTSDFSRFAQSYTMKIGPSVLNHVSGRMDCEISVLSSLFIALYLVWSLKTVQNNFRVSL